MKQNSDKHWLQTDPFFVQTFPIIGYPNFFLLFLLHSLREYPHLTAHISPVNHPAVWLLSSPLYWNRLHKSHRMICWLPNASSQSVLQHFTVWTTSFTLWLLPVCSLLSVPPQSSWLALLLLPSEIWCPLEVSPQLLCFNTVPLCLNSIHSHGFICHIWGWPANRHLQAVPLTCIPNLYFPELIGFLQ